MNLSPGYLWASIVCTVAVLFILALTVIDRRTPKLPAELKPFFEPGPHDYTREDRLELYMLTAIARGDAALAAYTRTGDKRHLSDGVLDMRYRLAQGLDMQADELAERLDETEGAHSE